MKSYRQSQKEKIKYSVNCFPKAKRTSLNRIETISEKNSAENWGKFTNMYLLDFEIIFLML